MNDFVIYSLHSYYKIDSYEAFIIGLVDSNEDTIDVSRLINTARHLNVASLATIHKAMQKLIDKGYITLKTKESDRRNKILTLTGKANKYLAELRSNFNTKGN